MPAPEAHTPDGTLRGRPSTRALQWRGIPYAAAPVGELRLRAPRPVRPWTGVRDATRYGPAAPQRRTPMVGLRPTGEACLTLNITTPPGSSPTPRPVLVFLHGGGYLFDTAARYPGDSLAARGEVVVVTVDHRLGALGYVDFGELSTPERPFESNLGLRDQLAALHWVRRNIAAFGGDPGNVTLFGESSGADAVLTLMTVPAAAGLFHRAIAQSPAADWAAVDAEAARRFARRLARRLALSPSAATPEALCRATDRALREALRTAPGGYPIAPVVDGDLLPQHPLDAFAEGRAHPVPLIIGTNRDECTLARFDPTVPSTAPALRAALHRCGADHDRLAAAYPGYPKRAAAIRLATDFILRRSVQAVLDAHSHRAPTYAYRFDFAPPLLRLTGLGATHGLELLPVFGGVDSPPARLLTLAGGHHAFRTLQHEIQSHWLSFAHTAHPLPTWPPYTPPHRTTLILDHPSHPEDDPHPAHRLLWQGIRIPGAG
ncbi:carboxylesterase/lipase family protein [Kitasatospora sp. NPDC051170]|uniref:carboxylesterase/lipase family protein n=1 Tax=Kitasatospora sp. NPDC051170 TaxID=3364056 RepID=UPI0037A755D5